jgi:hypothetical protein
VSPGPPLVGQPLTCVVAVLSVFIINSIQLRTRTERYAIGVIVTIGFLSIAAAAARWGTMYYVWSDPAKAASRITTSNLVLMEHFMRIEILLGTVAYGLPIARNFFTQLVEQFRILKNTLGWSDNQGCGSRGSTGGNRGLDPGQPPLIEVALNLRKKHSFNELQEQEQSVGSSSCSREQIS